MSLDCRDSRGWFLYYGRVLLVDSSDTCFRQLIRSVNLVNHLNAMLRAYRPTTPEASLFEVEFRSLGLELGRSPGLVWGHFTHFFFCSAL